MLSLSSRQAETLGRLSLFDVRDIVKRDVSESSLLKRIVDDAYAFGGTEALIV